MLERLLEAPEEAIHEELDESDLEASEEDVEVLAEKYAEKIGRLDEMIAEELDRDLQLIAGESGTEDAELAANGSGELERYESRGVEYVSLDGIEVKLSGQNSEVHPEAVVLAEKAGEVPGDEFDLEYHQRYEARKSLGEQGLLEDEELADPPEEIVEEVAEHVTGGSGTGQENPVEESESSTETSEPVTEEPEPEVEDDPEMDYEFREDTLVIETSEGSYEVLARHNGTPSNELEMLGYIAGVGDFVSWYHDSDTDSEYLSEQYFQAFATLEEEGIASGSDHEGFELEIELPGALEKDLRQELRRDYRNQGEFYEGRVIGREEDGSLKIKYDEGIAFVEDYEELPQMGEKVEFVEQHEEGGRTIGELA